MKPSIRSFILAAVVALTLGGSSLTAANSADIQRPNLLLITVDDMGCDTPGCFGGTVENITPNIDRLAAEGLRFENGHVYVAVCQPSRQSMMTGRYNHRIGALGFSPIDENITTLQEVLDQAGYVNGILGKTIHLAPGHKYKWSYLRNRAQMGYGRDAQQYYADVTEFLNLAKERHQPFFLMANSHDPHRPFHGSAQEQHHFGDKLSSIKEPSRIYSTEEVPVPGFLPELPQIREEMAQYYSSAKRADDTVGAILQALEDAGHADDTLVMFISDNGMPVATAKWNTYLQSTKTPWIVRWPGKVKPGSVDREHFISGVDYMPTILDALELNAPGGMNGRSFLPVLEGRTQPGRDKVFTAHYQWIHYYGNKEQRKDILDDMVDNKGWSYKDKYGGLIKNMHLRSVQNARFGYIYNHWANGTDEYIWGYNLTAGALRQAAQNDDEIAERLNFIRYRAPEEFYDLANDPSSLNNLIDDPAYAEEIKGMRAQLMEWMEACEDPIRSDFAKLISD